VDVDEEFMIAAMGDLARLEHPALDDAELEGVYPSFE
jgi:hypothetical protein